MNFSNFHFFIGCSVAITSNCLSSLGINLQASALKQERILNNLAEQQLDNEEYIDNGQDTWDWMFTTPPPIWFCRLRWYFGFILYILMQMCGSVIALGYISPMILAPLGASGLIFNIVFGAIFLGTRITRIDWIGTCLIVVGCSVVSTVGSQIPEPKDQTLTDLIELFTRPAFIAYFSVLAFVCFLILILIKTIERSLYTLKIFRAISFHSISRRNSRSSRRSLHLSTDEDLGTEIQLPLQRTLSDSAIRSLVIESSTELLISPVMGVLDNQEYTEPEQLGQDVVGESTRLIPRLLRDSTQTRLIRKGQLSKIVGILYAILGGIVASMTLLLTKSGVEIVFAKLFEGESDGHLVFSLFITTLLATTAVCQVTFA
jgi:Magnesium transporter NIPA